jgi:hypothetical protein
MTKLVLIFIIPVRISGCLPYQHNRRLQDAAPFRKGYDPFLQYIAHLCSDGENFTLQSYLCRIHSSTG